MSPITHHISLSVYLPDYVVYGIQEKPLRVSEETHERLPVLVEHRVPVFCAGWEWADAIQVEGAVLDVTKVHYLQASSSRLDMAPRVA